MSDEVELRRSEKVHGWSIDRSGGAMRILGHYENGIPVKITRVANVKTVDGVVIATRCTSPVETIILA